MELILARDPSRHDCTISNLYFDEGNERVYLFLLEDQVRPAGVKVYGKTAIPAGRFRVEATYSQKFRRYTMQIMDVPGFGGIRIHPGNDEFDTLGCLLPGLQRTDTTVLHSRGAVAVLERHLIHLTGWDAAHNCIGMTMREPTWITITNPADPLPMERPAVPLTVPDPDGEIGV